VHLESYCALTKGVGNVVYEHPYWPELVEFYSQTLSSDLLGNVSYECSYCSF
jgi:hypothetical protein